MPAGLAASSLVRVRPVHPPAFRKSTVPVKPTLSGKNTVSGKNTLSTKRSAPARTDRRRPFVLDTRELGRHPGLMRRAEFSAPAPAGLRVELIGVPDGAPIEADLRLEAVMEGVLVSGSVVAPLAGECGRCLGEVNSTLQAELQELFVYPGLELDDDEMSRLDGDLLDLEPVLRDAVVLALPLTPVCREDCRGLCVDCGQPLDQLPPEHSHDRADPRWAALTELSLGASPATPAFVHLVDQEH